MNLISRLFLLISVLLFSGGVHPAPGAEAENRIEAAAQAVSQDRRTQSLRRRNYGRILTEGEEGEESEASLGDRIDDIAQKGGEIVDDLKERFDATNSTREEIKQISNTPPVEW
eukprot:CAMPEP_0183295386 /NCGR_PEP_ID=MMETSP0160_2-20130417/3364_1 /TAXON_ID=2839 ORGANISM="Odontella Sinensis, Strain Grunow 1884" /NCGR_SAMPLE_ID=MMETSP0160_2 /ASSEMBLY_ACC=CAM_ASM_000250 /LENGTH=113 /DNA_ID=CAMNT_0025456865 /DNA_START=128 /DNA_END=466 /DNA_ORIENTATION=+